ncbi:endonuclease/exonuclease/phosphatase family metal-dependent hydrolase [Streptomyces sp. Ag109_O5-1]|uniref:endonuclease/exonuclease/phosphatase family protein n=1 Tax=Streptomyces sp. Ag109_O5-1 TaxID=1938851 RepID=UPI000F513D6A|nr:endonuclease/exonuclease/phosphatase family protein [Streptomyces sp. Ag109_O5-1]RPE38978.1 endonuclease/exonuclease/phosphatase family metal-dependent hydrolase [Streptomyces sp. Ag109_O5-1]
MTEPLTDGPVVPGVTGPRMPTRDDPAAPDAVSGGPGPVRRAVRRLRRVHWSQTVTVLWLVAVLVHTVLSGRWWPMLLPDLAPPFLYLTVPLLLAAVALAGRLRRSAPPRRVTWTAVAAAALSLVLGWNSGGLQWRVLFHDPASGTPNLRVVSWNTQYWGSGSDRDRFYRTIRAQRADVYLLQEYITTHNDGATILPVDELAELRHYFTGYHIGIRGELVTLSRLPVVAERLVGPGAATENRSTNWQTEFQEDKVLRTDVRVAGRTVSLYNVHVPVQVDLGVSPLSGRLYRLMHANERARKAQFAGLTAELRANHGPLLVAGDFNTSPAMGDLRTLRGMLHDAADAGDSLYPASWNNQAVALWRLDWAFTDGPITTDRYRIDPMGGLSDHRAQVMSFTVDPAGQ